MTTTHIQALEKFSLKVCYKAWNEHHDDSCARSGLQSLAERRNT